MNTSAMHGMDLMEPACTARQRKSAPIRALIARQALDCRNASLRKLP